MAALIKYFNPAARAFHFERKRYGREEAQARVAATSRTIYIGNMAFVTTDTQLYALFSRCGPIERVIMGLHRINKMPCGFAFVIFMERESVIKAMNTLHGTVLDDRVIKVEVDKGFYEGRQFGRGETGGQVRDDLRVGFDEGRGGFGTQAGDAALSAPLGDTSTTGMSDSRRFGSRDSPRGGGGGGRGSYRGSGDRGVRGGGGGGRGGYRRDSFGPDSLAPPPFLPGSFIDPAMFGGPFGIPFALGASPGTGGMPHSREGVGSLLGSPGMGGGTSGGSGSWPNRGWSSGGRQGGRGGRYEDRKEDRGDAPYSSGYKRGRPSYEAPSERRREDASGREGRDDEDRVRDRYREGDRDSAPQFDGEDLDEFGRVRRGRERAPDTEAGGGGGGAGASERGGGGGHKGRFEEDGSDEERGHASSSKRRRDDSGPY